MSQIDFSIKGNSQICSYFEGSDEYVPTSEFMYLHEHPMIQNTFMQEIEILINTTLRCLVDKKVQGYVVDKFVAHTKNLGVLLPDISEATTPKVLVELREVYKFCNELLAHYNFK